MEDRLTFKLFAREDIDLLFEWANEEGCRANSFDTKPIEYDTHVKWCQNILTSNMVDIFIIYLNNIPVAQVRLAYEENKALISYSIDKKFRGLGLGYRIVELIVQEPLYRSKCDMLIGKVKILNIASQKVFERCGYNKEIGDNYFIYRKDISFKG